MKLWWFSSERVQTDRIRIFRKSSAYVSIGVSSWLIFFLGIHWHTHIPRASHLDKNNKPSYLSQVKSDCYQSWWDWKWHSKKNRTLWFHMYIQHTWLFMCKFIFDIVHFIYSNCPWKPLYFYCFTIKTLKLQ